MHKQCVSERSEKIEKKKKEEKKSKKAKNKRKTRMEKKKIYRIRVGYLRNAKGDEQRRHAILPQGDFRFVALMGCVGGVGGTVADVFFVGLSPTFLPPFPHAI